MASTTLFTVLPFSLEFETPFFQTVHKDNDRAFQFLYYASLILGCLLLTMQAYQLLSLIIPKKILAKQRWLARLFTPQSVFAESKIKEAASFKVKKMMRNASAIHQSDDSAMSHQTKKVETSYGRALLNFSKNAEVYERAGGLWWTWSRMRDGTLYSEEGIVLNSQVMAGNAAQVIVCLFILVAGIQIFLSEVFYEEEDVDDDFVSLSAYAPEKWMVLSAIIIGLACGLFAAIYITLHYVPSSVSTIIQFRSGVIPSLRDKSFMKYRYSQDLIAVLFGSIFWGAFYTSLAVFVLIGLVVFVAVWQVTSNYFLAILAQFIGLSVTVLLRFLVLMFLRRQYHAAFYRKHPSQSNVLNVVLGSWHVALATGYVLVRGCMLLIATSLHIGRIDIPFLAPDVGKIGPSMCSLDLDGYPIAYRKSLLSSEAHRHPYIERLGQMYMMKLRYGDGFAKTSGSVWRLLFVFALMPWLRKYRILARPELQDDDVEYSNFRFGRNRMLLKPNGLRRRPDGPGSKDGNPEEEHVDPTEKENNVLKEENERLKRELDTLREQHVQLLQKLGLDNANEAKRVIKC